MKGDFSRLRFGDLREEPQVMMQQGRVLLDSDWNAQAVVLDRKLARFQRDVIGPAGGPDGDLGFEITGASGLEFNPHKRDDGQHMILRQSPSLPFHQTHMAEDPLALALPEMPPPGLVCYTLEAEVLIRAGSSGTFLHRPGHSLVTVKDNGHLALTTLDTVLQASAESPDPLPTDRPVSVIYVAGPAFRLVLVDGVPVAEAPPEVMPADGLHAEANSDKPALVLAAALDSDSGDAGDFLNCRIDSLRIWRAPLDGVALFALLARDVRGPGHLLVCDLDFGRIEGNLVPDHSGHHNGGLLLPQHSVWRASIINLTIGRGQYFVDGNGVVNPAPVRFGYQPWLPRGAGLAGFDQPGCHMIYLDVWQRFVTAVEDPALREVALGGPDTTGRAAPVWQACMLLADDPNDRGLQWRRLNEARELPGRLAMRRNRPAASMVGNDLFRVEIANPGWALPRGTARVPAEVAELAGPLRVLRDRFRVLDALTLSALDNGVIAALLVGGGLEWRCAEVTVERVFGDGTISIDPASLAALPEGSLDGELRLLPLATFRFSPSNGSDANALVAIEPVSGAARPEGIASLLVPGPAGLSFKPGDWVELTNRRFELAQRPGPLYRLGEVDSNLAQVTLLGWAAGPDTPGAGALEHALLRRWAVSVAEDATQDIDRTDETPPLYPVEPDRWIPLSHGVGIRFQAAGWYGRGAYWTAPTRAGGEPTLEWPGNPDAPAMLPPEGPALGLAPLADLDMVAGRAELHDRRLRFHPLSVRDHASDPLVQAVVNELAGMYRHWAAGHAGDVPRESLREFVRQRLLPRRLAALAEADANPSWHRQAAPAELSGPCCGAVIGGQVVVVAESDGKVWQLDLAALAEPELLPKQWSVQVMLPQLRRQMSVAALGDVLFLMGGSEASADAGLDKTDMLLPGGAWRMGPVLPEATVGAAAVAVGDTVYVCGGRHSFGGTVRPTLWSLRYGDTDWQVLSPMPTARADLTLVAYDGHLYAMGGCRDDGSACDVVERYAPLTDTWVRLAALPAPTMGAAGCALAEGPAVAGGYLSDGGLVQSVAAAYDPGLNRWRELPRLVHARAYAALVAVPGHDPQMLAVGGRGERDSMLHGGERLWLNGGPLRRGEQA